jgi:RHS repeat-associated protein
MNRWVLFYHRFAGMEWDADAGPNGLYYTWFRYYDLTQGRWMSVDPLAGSAGDPQSLDRYVYSRNDPVNLCDPLGLDVCQTEVVCVRFQVGESCDPGKAVDPCTPIFEEVCTEQEVCEPDEDPTDDDFPWDFFVRALDDDFFERGHEEPNGEGDEPRIRSDPKLRAFYAQLKQCLRQELTENTNALGRDIRRIAAFSAVVGVSIPLALAALEPGLAPTLPVVIPTLTANTFVSFGFARLGFYQIANLSSTAGCTIFTGRNAFAGN